MRPGSSIAPPTKIRPSRRPASIVCWLRARRSGDRAVPPAPDQAAFCDMAAPEASEPASAWVRRFAPLIPPGPVLDLACGKGRHSRYFLKAGRSVTAIDIDLSGVADLLTHPKFEAIAADLESGEPRPLAERRFAGVIVTNYLHRPLFPS